MDSKNQHITPIELITKVLAKEATQEEKQQVGVWQKTNPENIKEYKAIEKLWNISDKAAGKDDIDVENEWKKLERTVFSSKVIVMRRVLQVAASVTIFFIISFFGLQKLQTTSEKTAIAEISEITLPDGSHISINAKSKISYKKGFGNEHRELALSGEAFFDVKKNDDLPFIISAQNARIEVVGTQFYVKANKKESEIKVTVEEGKVKLSYKKQPQKGILLTPGETGIFKKDNHKIEKISSIDINEIAWKTHIFNFHNTSLSKAAQMIGKAYHYDIQVAENMKDCIITVSFEDLDLQTILKVLKSTLDLEIKMDGKRINITGKGC